MIDGVGSALARLGRVALNAVYPMRCAVCGRRGSWVCGDCARAVPLFEPPWCVRCGSPLIRGRCRCHELPISLDRVRSAAPYDGWVRQAILAVKFGEEPARAESIGHLLPRLVTDVLPLDGLVPVPLHPRRLKERGFNQSALLARYAAGDDLPVLTEILARTRPTRHQVGLGADERRANVHGAFAVLPGIDLTGRRLALVDDVLTTGATIGNCAEALKAAGAEFVAALTVARE